MGEAQEQPVCQSQPVNGASKEKVPSRCSKSVQKIGGVPRRANLFRATRAEIDEIISSRIYWLDESVDEEEDENAWLPEQSAFKF